MQKIKSIKWSGVVSLIKCCLIGIVATLIGTVIFAYVLKVANLSSTFISYINNIIKGISIFIMITCIKKSNGEKLLVKSIFAGILYGVISFLIFSILSGGFNLNVSFLYDLIFAVIVSVVVAVIVNILSRKNV